MTWFSTKDYKKVLPGQGNDKSQVREELVVLKRGEERRGGPVRV